MNSCLSQRYLSTTGQVGIWTWYANSIFCTNNLHFNLDHYHVEKIQISSRLNFCSEMTKLASKYTDTSLHSWFLQSHVVPSPISLKENHFPNKDNSTSALYCGYCFVNHKHICLFSIIDQLGYGQNFQFPFCPTKEHLEIIRLL